MKKSYRFQKKQALRLYKNTTDVLKNKLNKLTYQLNQLGYDCTKKSTQNILKTKNFPDFIHYKIHEREKLIDQLKELKRKKTEYISNHISGKKFDSNISSNLPIFVVLGNHELNDFKTIDDAIENYSTFFKKEKIWFLHNNMLTSEKINILGGIGFAKFNYKYNANTLCSTNPPITREEEIAESEKFLEKYKQALNESIKDNKLLIVITHYPVKDWLENEKFHSICVYFNGHSHQNNYIHTDTVQVYADNQIGYKNNNIQFKTAHLGTNYNPFISYKDGYYEINTLQYKQFLLFKGEYIQGTSLIDLQLHNGNAKFYMVKKNGFYGFFVVNKKTGTKICVGGRLKTISKITDIEYFYNCFLTMLNKYLSIFTPYRKMQEEISQELKQLGFNGKIHGCIIDINFYYHILLNPMDGKLTFYYSPVFGCVKTFSTFTHLIHSFEKTENIKFNYNLTKQNNDYLILKKPELVENQIKDFLFVDRKNSVYLLSNRINQIQRIFDSRILREWNDDWAQFTLNENNKYLIKTPLPHIKSDEECDQIIEKNFDEYVAVVNQENNFVLWKAKKFLKQEIMYSVCRKFISTYGHILNKYNEISFKYEIYDKESDSLSYTEVACSFVELFKVHKNLLSPKFGHNDVVFRLDLNNNTAEITVILKGKKDLLTHIGAYKFSNNELIKNTDKPYYGF